MSFEEIISKIQNKPEIWLSSHPLHKNRIVKAKVWRALAVKLGIEEDTLKKRWKHLRDQYRKELKKQPVLKCGVESEDWESSWQYFNLMSFVKDEIMPTLFTGYSNLNSQIQNTQETENMDTQYDTHDLSSETIGSATIQPSQSSPVGSSVSQHSWSSSRKRTKIKEDILEIERKKLKLMEKRLMENQINEKLNNDEDFLFLRSILPSMKKLTELQKLQFRGKVNDWFIEAMTENERALQINQSHYSGMVYCVKDET